MDISTAGTMPASSVRYGLDWGGKKVNHRSVLQWDAMLTMIWSTNVYRAVC